MELHIIHLPHRTDRLQFLKQEIAEQEIANYRIWNGITTAIPSNGIARAHQQIITYAKANRMTEIMIAEDDIHFTAPGAFNFFIRHRPVVYDIYLGGILWRDTKDHETLVDFCGLALYMIHEKFYDKFLGLTGDMDIDRELAGKGNFTLCQPMVAMQYNGYSDNRKCNCNFERHTRSLNYYRE
jgi:GT2 family glycosyltransferase